MIKTFARVLRFLLFTCIAVLLIVNIYTAVARNYFGIRQPTVFGWSSAVVVTGSMAGEEKDSLGINDLVIIHARDTYRVGDIITFESGNSLVTHRIVGETEDSFITKGDANNVEDRDPVLMENIVGKVVLSIPKIGLIIGFIKTPAGLVSLALIGCSIIVVSTLFEGRRRDTNKGDKSE